MSDITLVILAAGNSSRFEDKTKKQWLRIGSDPLWLFVAKRLSSFYNFDKIIITSSKEEINYMSNFTNFELVEGGQTRQESLKNALNQVQTKYVMTTDAARICIDEETIKILIGSKEKGDIIVTYLHILDTIVFENQTIDREKTKLIQTPQLSNTAKLKEALSQEKEFTDDSSAMKNCGFTVFYVEGSSNALKLTKTQDIKNLPCIFPPVKNFFTGWGFDVHPFEEGKKMFLGGVEIDAPCGFKAHSDGDVALHALCDALLGASGAGDIGELFPDTDQAYKGIDSKILLEKTVKFIKSVGYEIVNIDITIMAQKPKILPFKEKIKKTIAKLLDIEPNFVNIKATTTEKLGFIGREEGVGVAALANLKFYDWSQK